MTLIVKFLSFCYMETTKMQKVSKCMLCGIVIV